MPNCCGMVCAGCPGADALYSLAGAAWPHCHTHHVLLYALFALGAAIAIAALAASIIERAGGVQYLAPAREKKSPRHHRLGKTAGRGPRSRTCA
jgi:hypothetical protein